MKNIVQLVGATGLLCALIVGCFGDGGSTTLLEGSAEAPGASDEGVEALCDDYAVIEDGIYKYENNTWGVDDGVSYQQCLISREEGGQTQYGWTWSFKGQAPDWVYSYPEIIVGWKPWGEALSTDDNYPVKVADVESLTIEYDIELSVSGGYNLAPEIWLISQQPESIPMDSPQNLITTEIMFWMDKSESASPAGTMAGTFNFGGKEYDLYVKSDHNNSGDTVSWQIYSLVSHETQLCGTIDVIGLINMLIDQGYAIDSNEYIATVEFGTETIGPGATSSSEGTVWVNEYSVSLETK